MKERKKVALVLSGGGALGISHIGVIKVLLEYNIPIDIITGTSMGALIGGIYAATGDIKKIEDQVLKLRRLSLVDFDPFVIFKNSLFGGGRIKKILIKMVNEKKIEDCDIKFACVATNLKTGEKKVFDKGNLVDSITASIAVPGLFSPLSHEENEYFDGGLVDNLPTFLAKEMGADIIIAVDVCRYKPDGNLHQFPYLILSAFRLLLSRSIEENKKNADILISVDQPEIFTTSFTKKSIPKSIKFGEKYTTEKINEIKELLNKNGIKVKRKAKVKEEQVIENKMDVKKKKQKLKTV